MTESANIALIRRWIEEVWNQRRDATVHELLDPNSVGHLEGLVAHGVDQFLDARAFLTAAFPDFHLTIEDAIAQDSHVAIRWSAKGTHRGALLGVPATGAPVVFRGLTWFRLSGGRIVEGWDSWNLGGLLADLRAAAT
jgi:steroid delta-isomerase-like uncharacterized protein